MRKQKYTFHIEAGSRRDWNGNIEGINIHIKAYDEKEALETAKRLYKRRYYEVYRIDKEVS